MKSLQMFVLLAFTWFSHGGATLPLRGFTRAWRPFIQDSTCVTTRRQVHRGDNEVTRPSVFSSAQGADA